MKANPNDKCDCGGWRFAHGPDRCYHAHLCKCDGFSLKERWKFPPDPPVLACSFCGKGQKEVMKLISGPSVNICDECVSLCNDIVADE